MISSISSSAAALAATSGKPQRAQPSIYQAQADSAKADQEQAEIIAQNAAGIQALAAKGFQMTLHSFAGDYKQKVLDQVDSNHDATISLSELGSEVRAGGGSDQDASALYAAMDMNKDGTVSSKEFEDSLPDPFSSEAFIQQRNALAASASKTPAGQPSPMVTIYQQQAASIDTAALLAHMGQELSAATRR